MIHNVAGTVELIRATTPDLLAVNAARVSMDKHSDSFTYRADKPKGSDEGLLHYLASENHWTPFAHPRLTIAFNKSPFDMLELLDTHRAGMVTAKTDKVYIRTSLWGWKTLIQDGVIDGLSTRNSVAALLRDFAPESFKAFGMKAKGVVNYNIHASSREPTAEFSDTTLRITTPLALAAQLKKHIVGFAVNEVSRRYVDYVPNAYVPSELHDRPNNVKQGAGATLHDEAHEIATIRITKSIENSIKAYERMVRDNVAPEEARLVLPVAAETSMYITGHKAAWKRLIGQRTDSHSQLATQQVANEIRAILSRE